MASKRAAISELIKTDMAQRNITEEPQKAEAVPETKQLELQEEEKKEPVKESPAKKAPAEKAAPHGKADGALFAYINTEVESGGVMSAADRQNFYNYMLGQAERYIRGFKAGKRFYQG